MQVNMLVVGCLKKIMVILILTPDINICKVCAMRTTEKH